MQIDGGIPTRSPRALSPHRAILVACAAHIFLQVADGFFKPALHAYSPAAFWLFDVFKFVILSAVLLAWLARSHSITPSRYGLGRRSAEDWFNVVLMAIFLTLVLGLVYHFVSRGLLLPGSGAPTPFYHSVQPKGASGQLVAVYYGMTAGFAEEIFFRGLPLLYLRERGMRTGWQYVLVTSVLFSLAHWENGVNELVATFAFAVAAAAIYLKIRDLWPLVGAHALIDIMEFS